MNDRMFLNRVTFSRIKALMTICEEARGKKDYKMWEMFLNNLYSELNALTPEEKQKNLEAEYTKLRGELLNNSSLSLEVKLEKIENFLISKYEELVIVLKNE